MDKATSNYRLAQFKKLATLPSVYKPMLKIIKSNTSTNWLDVTEKEIEQIKQLLTTNPTPKFNYRKEKRKIK